MTDRAQIIDRVKALRARAGDAASSPAEVEAAAQRAAKLIAEHELTEADLREATADAIHTEGFNKGRRTKPIHLNECAHGIERLSETTAIWRRGGELHFFGFPEDVAFALYLVELVNGAATRAWKTHLSRRTFRTARALNNARHDFLLGFGGAVACAFYEAAYRRDADRRAAQSTGTNLVALKGQIIADHLAANLPNIRPAPQERASRRLPDTMALSAGIREGSQINPSRPLEDATEQKDAIQ